MADAAATLTACFTADEILIAIPDSTGPGFISGSAADSAAPWNTAAAYALMIPWHELMALEAAVRERAGLRPILRGGSLGNRLAALADLVKIARGLSDEEQSWIARQMDRWSQLTFALPSVHQLPQWEEIPAQGGAPDCPYCGTPNLRVHKALSIVACLYTRCPSMTGDVRSWAQVTGTSPWAWVWEDGKVQP